MFPNMLAAKPSHKISSLFKFLGDPFRLGLLLALSQEEACVCHLECLMEKRQAYISQHLMKLKKVGLVATRRRGKYIFYRLKDPQLLNVIQEAARVIGVQKEVAPSIAERLQHCECPKCGNSKLISVQ